MYRKQTAPRSVGGVIDSTFNLWLATLGAVALYVLIPRLAIAVINAFSVLNAGSGSMIAANIVGTLLLLVIGIASLGFYAAVIVRMHDRASGGTMAFGEALSRGFHFLGRTFLVSLLMGLMVAPIGVIAGIIIPATRKSPSSAILLVPLVIIAVLAFIFVFGRIFLALVFAVVEDKPATASIGASWALTRGHWWRCAAILTVLAIIAYVFLIILGALLAMFGFRHGVASFKMTGGWIIASQFIGVVFGLVATPLFTAAGLAIYYDLKMRKEGVDLAGRVDALAAGGT